MSEDSVLVILSETKDLFYATIILLKPYDYDKTLSFVGFGLCGDRIEAINGIRANDNNALYPLPDVLTLTVLRESGSLEIVVEKEQ